MSGDKEPGQHGDTELLKSPPAPAQPQLLLSLSFGPKIETEALKTSLGSPGSWDLAEGILWKTTGAVWDQAEIPQAPPEGCWCLLLPQKGLQGHCQHEGSLERDPSISSSSWRPWKCGIALCAQQQSHKGWQLQKSQVLD